MRYLALFLCSAIFFACSFDNPAKETEEPSEIEYCRWLLEELYLWELPKDKDSFTAPESLFAKVEDPYTRYVAPIKAPESEESSQTSFSSGEIGIELGLQTGADFPLLAYRIYPESPAARKHVPRFATLISLNGYTLKGDSALDTYRNVLAKNDTVSLTYSFNQDTVNVELVKEKIILPTVFLDTLNDSISLFSLREFREQTFDRENGTLGELKTLLKNLTPSTKQLIIDLRNNTGGSLRQCSEAADLFVKEGVLFSIRENQLYSDGKARQIEKIYRAKENSSGEEFDIVLFINGRTASCAEIFTLALATGNPKVKTIGTKTFGKGIAQGLWKTPEGALLYITSMQIYNRFGESYHAQGILPDYSCEGNYYNCLAQINSPLASLKSKVILSNSVTEIKKDSFGEAFFEGKILKP